MLSHEEAAQLIGHAVGGVCPFAVNDGVKIYLDESLKRFDTVYPACGSSNSMIELTPAELEEYSKPEAGSMSASRWHKNRGGEEKFFQTASEHLTNRKKNLIIT